MDSPVRKSEVTFTFGVEFEEETFSGQKARVSFEWLEWKQTESFEQPPLLCLYLEVQAEHSANSVG